MSEIDDSRIDSLPPEDNRNLLKDKVIECSWALNVIHYKSIGKWDTIITFHDQDDKKFKFGIASDEKNRLIHLNFGTPVMWMAFPPEQALLLADKIKELAEDMIAKNA